MNILATQRQRAVTITGRFVGELKAQREDAGQHKLDERLAIVEELEVGGLILEIDGDGTVFTGCFSGLGHV
jgi:hypothetical protein